MFAVLPFLVLFEQNRSGAVLDPFGGVAASGSSAKFSRGKVAKTVRSDWTSASISAILKGNESFRELMTSSYWVAMVS